MKERKKLGRINWRRDEFLCVGLCCFSVFLWILNFRLFPALLSGGSYNDVHYRTILPVSQHRAQHCEVLESEKSSSSSSNSTTDHRSHQNCYTELQTGTVHSRLLHPVRQEGSMTPVFRPRRSDCR